MVYLYTGDQNDNFIWGTSGDDYLRGMGGNDWLSGGDGNDILEGGSGDDRLDGMYGNNTYLFGRGDGRDVIMSPDASISKHNTIRFAEGIAPDDILVERLGDSLVLRIAGTDDSIVVDYYFQPGWGGQGAINPFGIEEIRFFDGASWDRETVLTRLDPVLELDDGDNFFFGRSIDGKGGNDYLEGTWNDDVLRGGDGDDRLFGAGGDDFLDGGAGNDLLDGGSGNNTFKFAHGGGHDVISLNGMHGSPNITVIDVANALPGTLSLTRSDNGQGNNLIISFKDSGDSITVDGFFDQNMSAAQNVRIQFADHSVWDAARIQQAAWQNFGGMDLTGTDQADTLQGDWADDRLNGGAGDDNLYGNGGNDLLVGGAGVNFLLGGWGSDVLIGGDDFDTLIGEEGDDILDAGAGGAFLDGGAGNNIILFGRNAGQYQLWTRPDSTNTIVLGADVRPDDLVVSARNSWEISISIKGTPASIIIPLLPDMQNVDNGLSQTYAQLKFADGTVWDNEILLRKMFTGDEDFNFFFGSERSDWMDGRGGNDLLDGQRGNDKLQGGSGDDTLIGGDGNDILLGQDGKDQLEGGMGDDLLNGGAGDDFMYAAAGNNVFQVDLNGGIDTVMSWYSADSHNVLQFGVGIAPEDLHLKIDRSNGSLVVYVNEGQEQVVTVLGYLSNTWGNTIEGLSELRFANGTVWDNAAILREANSGDATDNWIDGSEGSDTLDGRGGNDVLSGQGGDDVLIGGSGDDWLDGGMGDNTLNGGTGNDLLIGRSGADTYIFNTGDGTDRLDEVDSAWSNGGQLNVIRFGAGINAADVRFEQTPDTLIIHYGDGDAIAVAHTYAGMSEYYMPVNRFEFADNSVWTYTQLANQAPELVWPLDDTFVKEGAELSISMAGRFIDRNMDELSYQLEVVEGGNMPAWLQFDPLTGNISGTPGYHDSAVLMLKVTARDKLGAAASDEFQLMVTDVDAAPEQRQEIATQEAAEGSAFSLVIPADTFVDPDGGALWYKLALANDAPLPSWLQFDKYSMTLSGTPGDADTGVLELRLTAIDNSGKVAFEHFTLNVADINQAPVLVEALPTQSVTEATSFSITIPAGTFADPDGGDLLSYSLTRDGSALPAWLTFDSANMTLSGTPGRADAGKNVVLDLIATDGAGLAVGTSIVLSVNKLNLPPVLVMPPATVSGTEASPLNITFPEGTFIDVEGNVLRYSLALVDGPLPAWLNFARSSRTLSGTPGDSDTGVLQLRLTATNGLGQTTSVDFTLDVANINQAPVLVRTIAAQSATEASPFSITLPGGIFADADRGDVLSYSLALADGPLPAWLSFDSATMTVSGTPGDADTGILQLRLTATDSGGKAVSAGFELNVANINQAPVLMQAPVSQSVEDGVAFSYVLPATMFSDADAGDSGALAVDGLPAGFSFDAQTRTVSGMASLAEVGQHALTVSFTDAGGLRASAGFALTVTAAASVSVSGTATADTLTGKSNSDVLRGLGGDDILNGGIGADRMEGGSGNDTFYVDNAGDLVVENSAEGTDTVMASISYTLGANVERLTLTGNAINATGNSLNNTITGNSGNNVIDGGLGDDSMAGGAGNDTYLVGSTSDAVTEGLDAGFDRVISSVGRSLGANQEVLTLTGTAAINGNGNALNNLVQGNSGINSLTGGDGNDILQGGAGDDTISDNSFASGNLLDGGLGADRLTGGAGADLFIGGAGNDTINTSSGADIIAFNRGSGMDAVVVANGNDNTVSLGHGILYSDLSLAKSGNDLILKTGMGEQISFNGWYSSTAAHSVGTLQVITEGGADYVAGSASAIHDNKVEQFNFNALVAKFDQVRAGQGSGFSWNVASSLEAFSSGGSDSAAIGGDLAYQYALNDSLSAVSAMPALAIIGSPSFGVGSQALQGGAALNDGIAVLY